MSELSNLLRDVPRARVAGARRAPESERTMRAVTVFFMLLLVLVSSAAVAGPPSSAPSSAAQVLTLEKRRGHFFAKVSINGIEAGEFLVDTGASSVSIPASMARECHVDGPFRRVLMGTANGNAIAYLGKAAVTVGPFALTDVDVTVRPGGGMPLLGMSFLSQLDMRATPTTLELRAAAGMEKIGIADIDASRVRLNALGLPAEIGDVRCSYDEASDRWKCDGRVFEEYDGAATSGATSGMKVRIDLLRAAGCLRGVHMHVSASGKSLVVPWSQSIVVADGVTMSSPRASVGRSENGAEVSYALSLTDPCDEDFLDDTSRVRDVSWSVPVLVDEAPARVKWMHRWTPGTASEQALLETMTPPDIPPRSMRGAGDVAGDDVANGTFPLWTGLGAGGSLIVAGAAGGIAAAVAEPRVDNGLIAGAIGLAVSAPLLIGGGYLLDSSSADAADDEDVATEKARAEAELQRKRRAAYERQLAQ